MFALESNIIPHFEKICSVDQGTDVNPKVQAVLQIVKNAMAAREDSTQCFKYESNTELAQLNGAKINTGLNGNDFYIWHGFDLNGYQFSREGAEIVIDYFAKLYKDYYWYAKEVLGEMPWQQKKTKKRTRK